MAGILGATGLDGLTAGKIMGERAADVYGLRDGHQFFERAWFSRYSRLEQSSIDQVDYLAGIAVANIFNADELRLGIERTGFLLRSGSGVELILAAFRLWGPDCFARFRGDFACAVWDERERSLTLARDPIGHYPLYYWQSPGVVAFASEYKMLLALPDVSTEPNRTLIQRLQDAKYLPGDRTLLNDIRSVPPAHSITFYAGASSQRRYWMPRVDIRAGSERVFAERVRSQLLRSTMRQTEDLDQVGVNLSSGVDSAAALAALRQARPDLPIYTFTAGHGASDQDMAGAVEIARHFGTIHRPIVFEPERFPTLLPELVWRLEDPIARSELVHNLELARAAAGDVRVVFGGYGSDVLFGGTPKDKLIKLMRWLPPLQPPLTEFYNYTQISREPTSLVGRALKAGYFRGRERPAPSVRGGAERSEPWRFVELPAESINNYLLEGVMDTGWVQKDLRLHLTFDLDVRSPFFDRDMIELAFQIPERFKIRGWREKHILREAVRPWLPAYALDRPKYPHRMTSDLAFSEVLESYARSVLEPSVVRARGFFWPAEIERLLCRPARHPYSFGHAMRIWTLVMTELWARTFIDHRGAAPLAGPQRQSRAVPEAARRRAALSFD